MNVTSLALLSRITSLWQTPVRHYAVRAAGSSIASLGKKGKDKSAASSAKVKLEVETDPHKLVNFVCGSNIMETGEDIQLKPDSEYPDWLWDIHTGPPKKITDMEPGSKEYLEALKKINIKKALKLKNLSKIKQQ